MGGRARRADRLCRVMQPMAEVGLDAGQMVERIAGALANSA